MVIKQKKVIRLIKDKKSAPLYVRITLNTDKNKRNEKPIKASIHLNFLDNSLFKFIWQSVFSEKLHSIFEILLDWPYWMFNSSLLANNGRVNNNGTKNE